MPTDLVIPTAYLDDDHDADFWRNPDVPTLDHSDADLDDEAEAALAGMIAIGDRYAGVRS